MRILNSKLENSWNMSIPYEYSEEERLVLKNGTEVEKKDLIKSKITQNSNLLATPEDIVIAESLYSLHKPLLEQEDFYKLIDCKVLIQDSEDHKINIIYELNGKILNKRH